MAKIKINNLPEGFEVKNNKVVQIKRTGGSTGDQRDYGMVTVPNPRFNVYGESGDKDVKYSLSSVPREYANLEAEGGETVLTDLNNDGSFGLYNIKGPRHNAGGVPMYLPEQSFIYSDTKDLKFKPNELAEFGINSRKGMTPAKISNKYDLNKYYGAINDDFADDIKIKSAELMLNKNSIGLSKLAFAQEAKKNFEGGLPLAAYPYLVTKGENPFEFAQKIDEMNNQKMQQQMALKEMMDQIYGQTAQYGMEVNNIPMYQYGAEVDYLPMYQKAGETKQPSSTYLPKPYLDHLLKYEGGLSSNKNDSSARKGSTSKGYHTNRGVTYSVYNNLAKSVLGKNPSEKDFENLSEADALKIANHYVKTYDIDKIKNPAIASAMHSFYWGGMGENMKKRLKDTAKNNFNIDIEFKGLKLTPESIQKINQLPDAKANEFFNSIVKDRREYYNTISNSEANIKGWNNRLDDFISLQKEGKLKTSSTSSDKKPPVVNKQSFQEPPTQTSGWQDFGTPYNAIEDLTINPKVEAPQWQTWGSNYDNIEDLTIAPEPPQNQQVPQWQTWGDSYDAIEDMNVQPQIRTQSAPSEQTPQWTQFGTGYQGWEDMNPAVAETVQTASVEPTTDEVTVNQNNDLDGKLAFANTQYQKLLEAFSSNDENFQDYLNTTYIDFVNDAKKRGIKNIPSKQDMIDYFLDFQKNNLMVKALAPDEERLNPDLDKGQSIGKRKNEKTQELFNRLKEQYPDIYEGYDVDEDVTKMNQLFYQTLAKNDKNNYLSLSQEGPEGEKNWEPNPKISKTEGFYGNTTLNQFVDVDTNKLKPFESSELATNQQQQLVENKPRTVANLVPDVKVDREDPEFQFWLQDLLKTNAIAMRDREMFMPWQPSVERPRVDYVLEDPTREIAANIEAFNIGVQGAGAFGGPQALAARTAQGMGKTFAANANTLANVNSRNVGTINQGKALNAQLEEQSARENRQRLVKQYDDTQLVMNNYLNEKNFDREQYADALANMYTNAAYTYNMNTLYPNYNVDPSKGGVIDFYNPQQFKPTPQNDQGITRDDILRDIEELKFRDVNPTPELLNYLRGVKTPSKTSNKPEVDMMQGNFGFPFQPTARKGKEIKKYAVPFYSGKMGI